MAGLARTLQSAIDLLARDIYSSDARFLSELLQNADDSSYPDHTDAHFTVHLTKHSLYVHSNERGFTAKDVLALPTALA